jgi:hypothetical protein
MDMADFDDTAARNGTDPDGDASADPTTLTGLTDLFDADSTGPAGGAADVGSAIAAATGAPDVTAGLMSELSEAMMAVVARERDRVGAIVDADAAAHLAQAKERAATEAEAFRQVADEDVASIEAWAEAEIERIKSESATRVADRRADLDAYLVQHEAVLQGELDGIETAVANYKAQLDGFLAELRAGGDPAEIADRARALPKAPALDDVRAVARAEALTKIAEQAMAADEAAAAAAAAATASVSADEPVGVASPFTDVDADEAASETAGATADTATAVADDATTAVEADTTVGSAAPDPWAANTPVGFGGDGSDGERTGWESDGLESLMGPAPTRVAADDPLGGGPVAVMDPSVNGRTGWDASTEIPAGRTGWEMDEPGLATGLETTPESSVATAVAAEPMPPSDLGHPNAAVRLIRSVAPWTAPTHRDDHSDRL